MAQAEKAKEEPDFWYGRGSPGDMEILSDPGLRYPAADDDDNVGDAEDAMESTIEEANDNLKQKTLQRAHLEKKMTLMEKRKKCILEKMTTWEQQKMLQRVHYNLMEEEDILKQSERQKKSI